MSEATPYSADRVPAPPALQARLRQIAEAQAGAAGQAVRGGLGGIGLVLLVVFGAIGALDLIFGIIGRAEWIVLVLGSTILLVPMLLIHLRTAREGQAERDAMAARLRADAERGEVLRHELHRDARHWFVEHEHGVILVCPADARRTLYLDLSSVSDDERYEAWYAKGRIDTATWVWFTTTAGAFLLGFEATGAPLAPNSLEKTTGRYDPEIGGDLFEFLDSPADGDLVRRSFARVDTFLRERVTNLPPAR